MFFCNYKTKYLTGSCRGLIKKIRRVNRQLPYETTLNYYVLQTTFYEHYIQFLKRRFIFALVSLYSFEQCSLTFSTVITVIANIQI